jgi:hypothetical protein
VPWGSHTSRPRPRTGLSCLTGEGYESVTVTGLATEYNRK